MCLHFPCLFTDKTIFLPMRSSTANRLNERFNLLVKWLEHKEASYSDSKRTIISLYFRVIHFIRRNTASVPSVSVVDVFVSDDNVDFHFVRRNTLGYS